MTLGPELPDKTSDTSSDAPPDLSNEDGDGSLSQRRHASTTADRGKRRLGSGWRSARVEASVVSARGWVVHVDSAPSTLANAPLSAPCEGQPQPYLDTVIAPPPLDYFSSPPPSYPLPRTGYLPLLAPA